MRKLLLFALLFGVGLSLLLWLDKRSNQSQHPQVVDRAADSEAGVEPKPESVGEVVTDSESSSVPTIGVRGPEEAAAAEDVPDSTEALAEANSADATKTGEPLAEPDSPESERPESEQSGEQNAQVADSQTQDVDSGKSGSSAVRAALQGQIEIESASEDGSPWRFSGNASSTETDLVVSDAQAEFFEEAQEGSSKRSLRIEMRAAQALSPLAQDSIAPVWELETPVRLQEVSIRAVDFGPLAPATLTLDNANWNFGSQSFLSDSDVVVDSVGLDLHGKGLAYEENHLEIQRDIQADFRLPDEAVGDWKSPGPLVIDSDTTVGNGGMRLHSPTRSKLIFEIPEDARLEGDDVKMWGRSVERSSEAGEKEEANKDGETDEQASSADESSFQPVRIEVLGNVEFEWQGIVYRAQKARVDFNDQGLMELAVLEQEPSVEAPLAALSEDLELDNPDLPSGLAEQDLPPDTKLIATGAGPLRVNLVHPEVSAEDEGGDEDKSAYGSGFVFEGPIVLECAALDWELSMKSQLLGSKVSKDVTQVGGEGEVRGRLGEYDLWSQAFEVRRDEAQSKLGLSLDGPTRLTTRGAEENEAGFFDLVISERAQLSYQDKALTVQRAEGVSFRLVEDLDPLGLQPISGSAGLLQEANLETQTLLASAGVNLVSELGIASGERLEMRGSKSGSLWGTARQAARIDIKDGVLEANALTWDENRVTASGEARAQVETSLRQENPIPGEPELEGLQIFELFADAIQWQNSPAVESEESDESSTKRAGRGSLQGEGNCHFVITERFPGQITGRELYSDHLQVTASLNPSDDAVSDPGQQDPQTGESAKPGDPIARDFQLEQALATGRVRLIFMDQPEMQLLGEHLLLHGDGSGNFRGGEEPLRWVPDINFPGFDPSKALPLVAQAEEVEFRTLIDPNSGSSTSVVIKNPVLTIRGLDLSIGPLKRSKSGGDDQPLTIQAQQLVLENESLLFSGEVEILGANKQGEFETWLEAGHLKFESNESFEFSDLQQLDMDSVPNILAWGGFKISAQIEATGESFSFGQDSPGDADKDIFSIRGRPARIFTPNFAAESEWFEWNMQSGLLRANVGRFFSQDDEAEPWSLSFATLEPLVQADVALQIVREPTITQGENQIRASWAVFWVDPAEWSKYTDEYLGNEESVRPTPEILGAQKTDRSNMPSLIASLKSQSLANWLREMYIEGNIEFLLDGARRARADAMYLDMADGHGWMENVEVTYPLNLAKRPSTLKVQMDWVRHSSDGSLRAKDAIITTCDFDHPHYRIKTGDLRLTPKRADRGEESFWELSFNDNAIVFGEKLKLPLPNSFPIPLNKKGGIHFPEAPQFVQTLNDAAEAVGGQTSRFGSFFRLNFVQDLGLFGRFFNGIFGTGDRTYSGKLRYEVGLLGDRGLLLGLNPSLEEAGHYFLNLNLNGVYDTGRDRGILRVDESDRDNLRRWGSLRGRTYFGQHTWLDLVATSQSDPGVRSEFWESEYLRFEERENFAHLRHADGGDYAHLRVRGRSNTYRTQLEELPEAGLSLGRRPIARLGSVPLIYSSNSDVGYYRRRQGDPTFETLFSDPLRDRETLRATTTQRLETPFSAPALLGSKIVGFLEGNFTFWEEAIATVDDSPQRLSLIGGFEIANTFWKRLENGYRHEVVPSITYREDLLVEENGGIPIPLDGTEDPVDGRFVDFSLRNRLVAPDQRKHLDLELKTTWSEQNLLGREGWQPLRVNGELFTEIFNIPLALFHNARYDLREGSTNYSHTRVGFEPLQNLGVEVGYDSGREDDGTSLYNAYTLAGRLRATEKWELEGRATFSSENSRGLYTSGTVRRFGHDLVLEFEYSRRAGEGGSAFTISARPILLWRDSSLGLLDQWRTGRW